MAPQILKRMRGTMGYMVEPRISFSDIDSLKTKKLAKKAAKALGEQKRTSAPFPALPSNKLQFEQWLREMYFNVLDLQKASEILSYKGNLDTIDEVEPLLVSMHDELLAYLLAHDVYLERLT